MLINLFIPRSYTKLKTNVLSDAKNFIILKDNYEFIMLLGNIKLQNSTNPCFILFSTFRPLLKTLSSYCKNVFTNRIILKIMQLSVIQFYR